MAKNNELKMSLPSLDELFSSEKSRQDENLEKVINIPIDNIDDFPNHPYKVQVDDSMKDLAESIKMNGIMVPVIVNQRENDRYTLISGHRRKKACQMIGLNTIPAIIKKISLDEAAIMMVDANLQREVILPSEKAFSYKLRLEAMNRQGQRSDLTYSPLANKLPGKTSSSELAEMVGTSKDQIFRFIRLTELITELLQMVDDKQLGFRPAVELSYLKKEEQQILYDYIEYNLCFPSLAQAIKLKSLSQVSQLNDEKIDSIMNTSKQDQTTHIILKDNRFNKYFPESYDQKQKERLLIELLEKWYTQQKKEEP